MTTLLDNLMDSLAIERAAKAFAEAKNLSELMVAWFEHADMHEDNSRVRKLMQVAYASRLKQLTGALI
jgi:predicted transposase YbfD/YdcC